MAAANPLFSDLYGDASKWETPAPSYQLLTDTFGGEGAAPSTADVCSSGLVHAAARSPIILAFVTDADCDAIYVAHSLSAFPTDVTDPSTLDGLVVGLIGNSPTATVPVVFPAAFFTVLAATTALDLPTIQGAGGHGAAPPVFRSGPYATGTPNTTDLTARPAMVLPTELAALALLNAPVDGRFTLLGFLNTILQPWTGGTPAQQAMVAPLAAWWRLASTNDAGGSTSVARPLLATASPRLSAKLSAWASRVTSGQLARLGAGGPGLTNTAFALGVAEIKNVLQANQVAALEFERDKNNKTFTDSHGTYLADQLHRLCGVPDDEHLPPVHGLIANSSKGKVYALLTGLFHERSIRTILPLAGVHAPTATTKLVEDVFRDYQPGGDGQTFGKGLSPFAITMPGHENHSAVSAAQAQAKAVEAGASMSVADATALTAIDSRFPTTPLTAVEKLYGWSVVVDVFHGKDHPVAISIRNAAHTLGPLMHRLHANRADTPAAAIELLCRVLYDMQQDYFAYLAQVIASDPAVGPAVPVPTFAELISRVSTHRADALSPLPSHWYSLLDCPLNTSAQGSVVPRTAPAALRTPASSNPAVNAHANAALLLRYKDSGHPSITAMIGNRVLEVPKHSGKPICMTWALKGTCASNCKRKEQHVRYGGSTLTALHKFLDDCGVANSQA